MDKLEIGDVLAGSSLGSKSMGFITNELFDLAGDHAKSLKDEYLNIQTVNAARSDKDQPIEDTLEIQVSFQNDLIEILTEHLELPPFTFIDTRDGEHIVSVDFDEINQLFAFKSCPSHRVIDPHAYIVSDDEDYFEDFITVINDHGNIALYSWAGTEYEEVWAIV